MSHQEEATLASVSTADVKYKGVCPQGNGRYQVQLHAGGKRGYFRMYMYATAEEAARVYDREAKRRLGPEAVLNFLPDGSLNPFRFTRRGSRGTSMYKGVYYDANNTLFKAQLHYGGHKAHIGWFETDKEAALAYDMFVKQNALSRPLNFLPDGSLNPYRHDLALCFRYKRVDGEAEAPQVQRGSGAGAEDTNQAEEEEDGQERGEDEEQEGKEPQEEDEDEDEDEEEEEEEAESRRKRRRLNDSSFIDLTGDGPMQVIAPSPSSAAVSAASNRRRTRAAVGGGGPDGPIQPLRLPAQPLPTPASPTRVVKVEAASVVPLPAPLPPIAKVEAPAAQSRVQSGLKMELAEAVSILGQEAFKRLAACERGSEQMESFERLLELLPQLHREARSVNAPSSSSSPSSASPVSSIVDLRAFLLTSVCPRYTAEELKTNQPRLDDIMQMGICLARLS